jgi:hypothetical protein
MVFETIWEEEEQAGFCAGPTEKDRRKRRQKCDKAAKAGYDTWIRWCNDAHPLIREGCFSAAGSEEERLRHCQTRYPLQ